MKLLSMLPLAVALAATTAIGQDAMLLAKDASLAVSPGLPSDCPIGLTVKHQEYFVQRQIDHAPGPQDRMRLGRAVQRVQLTLTNPAPRKVVEVQITVRGFSNHERLFTLASASPDVAKKITLALDVEKNGQASSDLSLSDVTALSAVDVNSVRYADGSTWQASAVGACRVTPDSLMRVSALR